MAIVVTVREDQRGLVVTVDDDGSGCDISTRRRLEAMFADDARSAGSGVGLAAVHHRVRTLYGERFGLRLLPSDAGFSIQLLIPKLRSS